MKNLIIIIFLTCLCFLLLFLTFLYFFIFDGFWYIANRELFINLIHKKNVRKFHDKLKGKKHKNVMENGRNMKEKLHTINFLVNIDKVSSFCIKSHVKTSIFLLALSYYFYLLAMKKHTQNNNNNNILTVFEAFWYERNLLKIYVFICKIIRFFLVFYDCLVN